MAAGATPFPLTPMLASIGGHEVGTEGWVYEPKWDGVRILAVARNGTVRLITRNGADKARQFPEVADAFRDLVRRHGAELVLDGELIARAVDGTYLRFQALQPRINARTPQALRSARESVDAALMVFDILAEGNDVLVGQSWTVRRAHLQGLLPAPSRTPQRAIVRLGDVDRRGGSALLRRAHDEGWEGLIAKRADSRYRPGARSRDWVKVKLELRQEFVVGGFTQPRNSREHIGALLVGYFDAGDRLAYAGHVGTGFTGASLRTVYQRLARLRRARSPFSAEVVPNEPATWVRPDMVVEVRFNEWTSEGRLRQPVFLGVRDDKDPRAIIREPVVAPSARGRRSTIAIRDSTRPRKSPAPMKLPAKYAKVVDRLQELQSGTGAGEIRLPEGTLSLTSLDKPYWPDDGFTKGDLLRYYASVAPAILPVIADRPLVLRRYPNGIDGDAFYQQQAPPSVPDGVRVEPVAGGEDGKGETIRRFIGGDLLTLLYLVQLGAISVDPWHSRVGSLHTPDWSVIDLDPGPETKFGRVVDVALMVRDELERLGIASLPKTSGASGIHIMIPLREGTPSESARLLAQVVATAVAEGAKQGVATVERSVAKRPKSAVYVDYLQNVTGKSVACAYAARARAGATVSTPLHWDEVDAKLDPRDFTIANVPERLSSGGDLWKQAMSGKSKGNDLRKLFA